MALNMDILNSYYLYGLVQGLSPAPTFFRDRYFPVGAGDIYAADKVLVEYRDGDNGMAPFMVDRADPIAVERQGYEIHDYEPVKLANSRLLTLDDLKKRGFGEAILTTSTEAERAAKLMMDDLAVLGRRFDRSEEWLCAQTIINNGFTVDQYIDAKTTGPQAEVKFYDPLKGNDGAYTIDNNHKWDAAGITFIDICDDVYAMCRGLTKRGLPAQDLLLGSKVASVLLRNSDFRELLNKQSGIIIGTVEQSLGQYDGITYWGTINFSGYRLNVIVVDEQYKAANGTTTNYFPATSVAVTAPGAGHRMYAHITYLNENDQYVTATGMRIPRVFTDRRRSTRELIMESRPFAAPLNYAPWVYAANAVSA